MTLNQLSKYDEAAYSIKIKGLDGEQGQIKVKVISEPMITITTEENEKTVSVGESVSMAWKISGSLCCSFFSSTGHGPAQLLS